MPVRFHEAAMGESQMKSSKDFLIATGNHRNAKDLQTALRAKMTTGSAV